jgi:diphthamide synthase (EF-2-diphthine--ammonia ligase)
VDQPLSESLIAEFEATVIDACGERGEYHTSVSSGPLFRYALPISLATR